MATKPPSGSKINTGQSICSSMKLAWLMNEGSGTTLTDSSGNGNNGTFHGTGWAWGSGVYGTALLSTDGATGYISSSSGWITCPMTFFISFTPTTLTDGHYVIITSSGNFLWNYTATGTKWHINGKTPLTILGSGLQELDAYNAVTNGAGGTYNIYQGANHVTPYNDTNGGAINGDDIVLGGQGNAILGMTVDFLYGWNRNLTAVETANLVANPFLPYVRTFGLGYSE